MLVLFILTLTVSFIVVRIGAIAFQLTGLEWSLANFMKLKEKSYEKVYSDCWIYGHSRMLK